MEWFEWILVSCINWNTLLVKRDISLLSNVKHDTVAKHEALTQHRRTCSLSRKCSECCTQGANMFLTRQLVLRFRFC